MEIESVSSIVKSIGFDGLDLSVSSKGCGAPGKYLSSNVRRITHDYGIEICAVTAMFDDKGVDLSSPDKKTREAAVEFAKRCADVAAHCGCDRVLVSPSHITVNHGIHTSYEQDWKTSVEALHAAGRYAQDIGVMLMVEPINRYRVSLVHTISEAQKMVKDIGLPNIYIVPDTFHMSMEESDSVADAIKRAGKLMKCLHIGDNNRMPPGYGNIDWKEIILALDEIKFSGPLSYETVYLYFDAKKVEQFPEYRKEFLSHLETGRRYLQTLIDTVSTG